MATPFSTIEDLAFVTIQDYKLDQLYQKSPVDWETFLAGFVVRASLHFTNSQTDLSYSLEDNAFTNDLSNAEINILVYLFIEMWIERVAQNLTQIVSTMTPSDAKRTNVPAMVKEQQYKLDVAREKNSQRITEYGYANADFQQWANGVFF